jgi:hypothetical protein
MRLHAARSRREDGEQQYQQCPAEHSGIIAQRPDSSSSAEDEIDGGEDAQSRPRIVERCQANCSDGIA